MRFCLGCNTPHLPEQCPACSWKPPLINGFPAYAPELASRATGFNPELFEHLASVESGNFWFRARNQMIVDAISNHLPNATNMLEIGCGTGFVLDGIRRAFPNLVLTGSEIFVEGLDVARKRVPDAQLLQMDARRIPFRDEFDLVGAFDVIEHIEEDERVLSEILGALRPGGVVLVTVPQHPFLWSELDEIACHQRRYRRGEMEAKLRATGFEVLMTTSFVSFLLPVLAVARLRRRTATAGNPSRELELPRWLNASLYGVLALERHLINWGVRFPVGGTRLVVARKQAAS